MVLQQMKRIKIGNKYYNGCLHKKILTTEIKEYSLATNNPFNELEQIKRNINKPLNKRLRHEDITVISY